MNASKTWSRFAHNLAGVLHQGCKMILGGTSKSNKPRSLPDLA